MNFSMYIYSGMLYHILLGYELLKVFIKIELGWCGVGSSVLLFEDGVLVNIVKYCFFCLVIWQVVMDGLRYLSLEDIIIIIIFFKLVGDFLGNIN